MNKWIVVTTINPPQPAILAISKLCEVEGWKCVVVGDKKTPLNWGSKYINYLSIDDQRSLYPQLSELLPYNHYCRKNIGYLYAQENGAEIILETDDDNIPLENFGKELSRDVRGNLVGGADWINTYKYFTESIIWPRGNPLDSIHEKGRILNHEGVFDCPVQQYLADGDPDVDAVYRLIFKNELYFNKSESVILEEKSWCSFNSQNTVFYKEFFPLLYLPCHVSFRMTDIWRSFVAQLVLWSEGKRLSFSPSTVRQVRNEHNLMKDFSDEVVGYVNNREICSILEGEAANWSEKMSISNKVLSAWRALQRQNYIEDRELAIIECWLDLMKD